MAATIYEPLSTAHLKSCTVDFDSRPDKKAVNLVQYDQTIPVLCVSLKKGGTEYKVPSDADVNIRMDKRDGYHVYNPALGVNAERTIAYFAVTPQMSTGWGDYYPIVEITVGGGIAGSAPIWLHFDRNPLPENAIISSDEYKTIQQLLEDVTAVKTATEQIKIQTEAVRDQAKGFADNAKNSADKAQTLVDGMPSDYSQAMKDIGTLKNQMQRAYPDDSTIGENTWSSKNIVDMLCPEIKESGNPVLCYPVAGYPLGVKASWEPVQEGSGTPYPAGGGKNQLNPAEYEAATKTSNGITFTRLNTGEVVVNGTATGTAIYVLIANFSYLVSLSTDINWGIVGKNVISAQGLVSGLTVIRPSDNTSLYIRVQSGATVKATVQPQIEKGSTPTAWAPYENIRLIKGRDSVTVERCGENLLPFGERIEDIYSQQIMASDDLLLLSRACAGQKLTLTFSVETQNIVFNDVVEDEWRKRIGFECHGTLADGTETYLLQCWLVDRDGELTKNGKKTNTVTVTMPELVAGNIMFYAQNIKSGSFVAYDFGIYAGTTAPTTYKPYIGSTNTLTLPETVYGGEVDAVSSEGQETWQVKSLDGTEGWAIRDTYIGIYGLLSPTDSGKGICTHFDVKSSYNGDCIFISDSGTVYLGRALSDKYTVDTWCAYLSAQHEAGTPVQICYKLATPTSFTATGAKPLPALAGVNTALTDADSATVTGRADPIKRITDLEAAVASIN
jgi:hypothetical protein